MLSHLGCDPLSPIVDRRGPITFGDLHLVFGNRGKDLCTECVRKLHGDVPDSASSRMYENSLSGTNMCAIDQAFPSR
jgi:hypothetical protein